MGNLVVHQSILDLKLVKLVFETVIYGWTFVHPCSSSSTKYLLVILMGTRIQQCTIMEKRGAK